MVSSRNDPDAGQGGRGLDSEGDDTLLPPGQETTARRVGEEEPRADAGTLIGRYVVLSTLGAGTMGYVVAGYDPELDRKVAIKLVRVGRGREAVDQSRMLREAQALARVSHPNVVAIHDTGLHDGKVFLAMEFIDGRTLGAWTRGEHRRPWRDVVRVFEAAGRGLAAAHDRGLVHRDFKPDNVMIDIDGDDNVGRVRVMDFGLARAEEDTAPQIETAPAQGSSPAMLHSPLTETGALMGTPAYMAPELFAGGPGSARADQFAFCVAFWEALFGQRPFGGANWVELAASMRETPVPPNASVPRWLVATLRRGLQPQPDARFESMHALLAELASGERRRRRHRFLGALGVVAIGAASVVAADLWDEQQRRSACQQEASVLDDTWSPERAEKLRTSFMATDLPYADRAAAHTRQWLDRAVEGWRAHVERACVLTRVDGRWDEDRYEKSRWCLEEERLRLVSAIERFVNADANTVRLAAKATASLHLSQRCTDPVALASMPPPPPAPKRARVQEVREALARVGQLRETGMYDEALEMAGDVLGRAENVDWPPTLAAARLSEARALEYLGQLADAEDAATTAYMEAGHASDWSTAADAAILLCTLVGNKRARIDDGLVWAGHARLALAHAHNPSGAYAAGLDNALGQLYFTKGDYQEAQRHFQSSRQSLVGYLGPEHPEVAELVHNLGLVHEVLDQFEEAEAAYTEAIPIVERELGPDHPTMARYLQSLGILRFRQGRIDEAKALYERALAILKRSLPDNHQALASAAVSLGNVALTKGNFDEAARWYESAVTEFETSLGNKHPSVATALDNLGTAVFRQGNPEQALELYLRGLAIREEVLGKDHQQVAGSLHNVAGTYVKIGRTDEAEPLLQRAVQIYEATYGSEHLRLSTPLETLGMSRLKTGAYDEAIAYFERALSASGEATTTRRASVQFRLARALWEAPPSAGRDHSRALTLAREAKDTFETLQPDAPELAELAEWIAEHDTSAPSDQDDAK